MLANDIVEELTKVRRFIEHDGKTIFYFRDDETAQKVSQMLNKWYFSRGRYGPWEKDGDHWDHRHPDGIKFHHPEKHCPELI